MDGQTDGWMDGWTNGKSPHSTGLCPLSGPLPKKHQFLLNQRLKMFNSFTYVAPMNVLRLAKKKNCSTMALNFLKKKQKANSELKRAAIPLKKWVRTCICRGVPRLIMHPGAGLLCAMKGKIGPRQCPSGSSGQIRVFSKKSPKKTKIVKK